MAKVLTFSRTFPTYHVKAGQPTYFVEKIIKGLDDNYYRDLCIECTIPCFIEGESGVWNDLPTKHHTIRAGNRWKVGDKFSPRVWSGKPYRSKQIIIAPDIEIKKVWDVEIKKDILRHENGFTVVTKILFNGIHIIDNYEKLAANDGLSLDDLCEWFNKPMEGQIICWNENINY